VATSIINVTSPFLDLQRVCCVRFMRSYCIEYFSLVHLKPHLLVILLRFSSPTHRYIIHAHARQYKYNFMKMLIYKGQVHNTVLPTFHSSVCHTVALHFKDWSWGWQCLSCDMNCLIQTALVTIYLLQFAVIHYMGSTCTQILHIISAVIRVVNTYCDLCIC
jgi:hypothetical protein